MRASFGCERKSSEYQKSKKKQTDLRISLVRSLKGCFPVENSNNTCGRWAPLPCSRMKIIKELIRDK